METEKKEMKDGEVKEAEKKETQYAHTHEKNTRRKKQQSVFLKVVLLVLLIGLVGGFWYYKTVWIKAHITTAEAKTKVENFIKNDLVPPGTNIEISSITKENGLFKVVVKVGADKQQQEITSYLSQDGLNFFPSVMNIAQIDAEKAKNSNGSQQATASKQADIPKTDKPVVELFVMSYCPYGTQMEKGILPVLNALKSKIDFTLKFVSYSMHNDLASNDRKELDENLRQYCIQKNQPTKLADYLTCFLKKGQGTENDCMKSSGVVSAQVATCMTQADTQFNVTKDFQDKSTYQGTFPLFEIDKADNAKYNVQGSPTLVINGVEASSAGRDSASILKTICGAFNKQPKECSTSLSSTAPSPGFGDSTAAATGTAGSNTASCGN